MVQPSAFPCFSIAVLFIFPYCTSRAICLGEPVVVRTEWRISGRWLLKDQTEHISEGARRVCQHFETRPHSVLTLRDDAQRLLLGPLDSLVLPLSQKFNAFGLLACNSRARLCGCQITCWLLFDMLRACFAKIFKVSGHELGMCQVSSLHQQKSFMRQPSSAIHPSFWERRRFHRSLARQRCSRTRHA